MYFMAQPHMLSQLEPSPEIIFKSLNSVLIFMGLAFSFSSLQDTTKTQNKMSKKVWENPKKGKIMIAVICFLILMLLVMGLTGYYLSSNILLKEISTGVIVMALGLFGFLKAAVEMFENHRLDKNPVVILKIR